MQREPNIAWCTVKHEVTDTISWIRIGSVIELEYPCGEASRVELSWHGAAWGCERWAGAHRKQCEITERWRNAKPIAVTDQTRKMWERGPGTERGSRRRGIIKGDALNRYYTEQQLHEDAEVRAFSRASSSSAWAAHTGVVMGMRYTLSRFLNSFSASMVSLRLMIAVSSESNRCWTPKGRTRVSRGSRE